MKAVIFVVLLTCLTSDARILRFEPAAGDTVSRRHPNDVTYPAHDVTTLHRLSRTHGRGLGYPAPPRVIGPVNPHDHVRLNGTKRVLIIGGGLAGMSAALELAERGYQVTLREATKHLGGRYASNRVAVNATKFKVDREFISWLMNSYNFLDIMTRLNLTSNFMKWQKINYLFHDPYQSEARFNKNKYPYDILTMLWDTKNMEWYDKIKLVTKAGKFIHFNYDNVYKNCDNIKFPDWITQNGIPKSFYDVFLLPIVQELKNDNLTISTAEMMTYIYLYYLSTPQTAEANRLIAKLGNRNSFIGPWETYLMKKAYKKVKIQLSKSFNVFNFDESGHYVTGDISDGTKYDYCILATGSASARKILRRTRKAWSGLLPAAKALDKINQRVENVNSTKNYSTVRLWLNKPTRPGRPRVIFTPDIPPLSAVVLYHTFQPDSANWASKTNGSVIELQISGPPLSDKKYLNMTCQVLSELCPKAGIISKYVYSNLNAPSFDIGQGQRPNSTFIHDNGIFNLFLAGDWLKTEYPAAIGEKAVCTGREAANQILLTDHVRQAPMTVSSNLGPGW